MVVARDTAQCGVPGLDLYLDFVTPEEEQVGLLYKLAALALCLLFSAEN